MNNKTTEQPIPEEFDKWVEEMIYYSQQWDGLTGKEALKGMAIAAYRHLHSLPPSPLGEAGDKRLPKEVLDIIEMDADRFLSEQKLFLKTQSGMTERAAYVCGATHAYSRNLSIPEFPNPSRAGGGYSREEVIKIGEEFDDYLCAALSTSNVIMEFDEWFDNNTPPNPSRAGEISPALRDWISVKDRLPELTEPFMMYNDDNIREVAWENDHVFVLAFDPERGIIKAKRDKSGWSEVSTNSISGCVTITHWQHLPGKPGEEAPPTPAPEDKTTTA